ncbi:MAG: dTDP-4-dehydrorhamnose 3,5-epimerase [Chitinophagaceae bacterium]|jgi:dTDP-4-dehydrorhamnose 3,5-epimerase|nr:dTDP-4-dehydrorhamnose 3,5-epimerase [Sediminibacterium sp.]
MRIEQTPLKDCFIIHEKVHGDARGYFIETYNQRDFKAASGLDIEFVQDNQSRSAKGVLRGLHMQRGAAAQAKLVRVLEGAVLDIAVDLRKGSPSFGQHYAIELTADNHKQFFVPAGFAHGFVVLSETATFFYKVDKFYEPGNEVGIMYNDKDLNIDWRLAEREIILSEKDKTLGSFKEYSDSLE